MKKYIYSIKGFDCANCASKVEKHLNTKINIRSCVIDFQNDRMFIIYQDTPYTKEELLSFIKEVEDDPIEIEDANQLKKKKEKLFDKKTIFLLIRIAVVVALMVTGLIVSKVMFPDIENWQNEQNAWIPISIYVVALALGIYDILWEVIEHIIHLQNPIDEHLLMTLSTAGAFCIAFFKEAEPVFFDGVMVLALFQVGELIESMLSKKSKQAIADAIDLRADFANLVTDNKIVKVSPDKLNINDKIVIHVGEIVPVDGIVCDGTGDLDTSSLTGESMPLSVKNGDHVLSGTILKNGSLTLKVEKLFHESTISKIMELVQNSGEHKSKVDKFITRFARWYTPFVLLVAIAFFLIFGFVTKDWAAATYRSVFVLIVGCPCAIVISVPLAYFAGIGLASKIGVIIKGANILDQLCNPGVLFVDKTGTLTYGNFAVTKIVPNGITEDEFMTYLLSAESRSNHPIAKAIILHRNTAELALKQENYEELAGYGTHTNYEGHDIYAGNIDLLKNNGIDVPEINEIGTVIYVSSDGKFVGYVVLNDVIRDKAKTLVKKLNELKVKIVLLSGDTLENVKSVAEQVGIKEYHAKLLPIDKTKYVDEAMQSKKKKETVLFAGDGINDTPSIMKADVGFAMGGIGSDVAVENADVVIMQDHPLKIYHSIKIARLTRAVAIFNIVFALTIKVAVMVLTLTIPNFPPIFDILSDTGLTVLLAINSVLIIYRKIK